MDLDIDGQMWTINTCQDKALKKLPIRKPTDFQNTDRKLPNHGENLRHIAIFTGIFSLERFPELCHHFYFLTDQSDLEFENMNFKLSIDYDEGTFTQCFFAISRCLSSPIVMDLINQQNSEWRNWYKMQEDRQEQNRTKQNEKFKMMRLFII